MSRAVMAWVDALPDDHRALVNEFGVWPVHLALGRGLRGDALRREAADESAALLDRTEAERRAPAVDVPGSDQSRLALR